MPFQNVISRTELARSTRQAIEQARHGQTILVESYGEEQVAIVDALDYRLLRAVALYRSRSAAPVQEATATPRGLAAEEVERAVAAANDDPQVAWDLVITAYLDGDISLGRAAALLKLSRFDLTMRFNRLGLPMHLGATTVAEARAEAEALEE